QEHAVGVVRRTAPEIFTTGKHHVVDGSTCDLQCVTAEHTTGRAGFAIHSPGLLVCEPDIGWLAEERLVELDELALRLLRGRTRSATAIIERDREAQIFEGPCPHWYGVQYQRVITVAQAAEARHLLRHIVANRVDRIFRH